MFGRCGLVRFLLLALTLSYSFAALAAKETTVITDGAIVYRKPNFDAPTIGYFRAGQKVWISDKKFGGAFFRVRFKQGVLGYVADVDVEGGVQAGATKKDKKEADSKSEKPKKEVWKPVIARTLLGVQAGYTRYAELIGKKQFRDNMLSYGLKLTFPMFGGPFFADVNVIGSFSAPKFYRDMSSIPPQGMFVLGSYVLQYGIMDFADRRGLVYMGGGPVVAYSSYLIEVNGSKLDTTEIRAGGVFNLGVLFDLGGGAFKLEPKFYVEKASYNSYDVAIQFQF